MTGKVNAVQSDNIQNISDDWRYIRLKVRIMSDLLSIGDIPNVLNPIEWVDSISSCFAEFIIDKEKQPESDSIESEDVEEPSTPSMIQDCKIEEKKDMLSKPAKKPTHLNLKQASKELGMREVDLREGLRDGLFKGKKVNGVWRINKGNMKINRIWAEVWYD